MYIRPCHVIIEHDKAFILISMVWYDMKCCKIWVHSSQSTYLMYGCVNVDMDVDIDIEVEVEEIYRYHTLFVFVYKVYDTCVEYREYDVLAYKVLLFK